MAKNFSVLLKNQASNIGTSESYEKQIVTLLGLVSMLVENLSYPRSVAEVYESVSEKLNYFNAKQIGEMNDNIKKEIESINSMLACSVCKSNISICRLNCGHQICEGCVEQTYKSSVELKCCLCSQNFFPSEISEGFAQEFYKKFSIDITKSCADCERKIGIFANCRHYCEECLCLKYRKNDLNCHECQVKIEIPDELFSKQTFCSGCQSWVYVLGDLTKTVCNSHVQCLKCQRVVVETQQCVTCEKRLSNSDYDRVLSTVNSECSLCSQSKPIESFIPKTCCSQLICASCQSPSLKCLNCSSFLDPRSLSVLYTFSHIA